MFTLQFGITNKQRNSTFVPPLSITTNVLLKEQTSIIRPVFKISVEENGMMSASEIFGYNYCYCPEFKRYYFISDIQSYTAVIFYISCEVDVLATFREDILKTPVFVRYAQSQFNASLADNRLPMGCTSQQYTVSSDNGFGDEEGCFILTIASSDATGETGAAQSYVLTKSEIATVASSLYSQGFFDEVVKYLTNPLDAIISCTWVPISPSRAASGGSIPITIAGYPVGSGAPAERYISGEQNIEPHVEYRSITYDSEGNAKVNYSDYRNIEPYSQYSLWLPGVGLQSISMDTLIGKGDSIPSITIEYVCSPCTGDITYNICRGNDAEESGDFGSTVLTISGNFGVNVPVAQKNSGFGAIASNVASLAGDIAMTTAEFASGNMLSGIVGLADGISKAVSTKTRVAGSLGGWASSEDMYTKYKAITRVYDISDTPSRIAETIGRPLFANKILGELKGLVQCTGGYVKTWATEEEHQMISQYINTSSNYIYGGIIIE